VTAAARPNRRRILPSLAPDGLRMLHAEIDCLWTDELGRAS
jgi:hypothetical protein